MVAKTEGNWFGHGVVKTSVLGPGTRGETHSRATEPEPRELPAPGRPLTSPRPLSATCRPRRTHGRASPAPPKQRSPGRHRLFLLLDATGRRRACMHACRPAPTHRYQSVIGARPRSPIAMGRLFTSLSYRQLAPAAACPLYVRFGLARRCVSVSAPA
jgi:hypothetical protein